ncbi:MAG TPA: hypothetical protein VIR54_28550 [Vicinamibacterales bacterium]|jgi:hypothetical protein
MTCASSVLQPCAAGEPRERDLQSRIRAEYDDMPGLKLTLSQASRLFDVDTDTCARVLVRLIGDGVLAIRAESFVRRR